VNPKGQFSTLLLEIETLKVDSGFLQSAYNFSEAMAPHRTTKLKTPRKQSLKREYMDDENIDINDDISSDSDDERTRRRPSKMAKRMPKKVSRNSSIADSDEEGDDYKKKRERNNIAVKKSRIKSKMRMEETKKRVDSLKSENDELQNKIDVLNKELDFLKELFMAQAGASKKSGDLQMDLDDLMVRATSSVHPNHPHSVDAMGSSTGHSSIRPASRRADHLYSNNPRRS